MWSTVLQKHFSDRKWKKYYRNIVCFTLSVSFGLKPSFLWDFGPHSVSPNQMLEFIEDLKVCHLISNEVIIIVINDTIFISNSFHILKQKFKIIDITKNEKEWVLLETNKFVSDMIPSIITSVKNSNSRGITYIKAADDDCLPCLFGLLLGYPLIYYFSLTYSPTSTSLIIYKLLCKFQFQNKSDEFLISSFSIPLCFAGEDIKILVNEWFDRVKNVEGGVFHNLRLECCNLFVNSLNL